jgi:hypothetical protein
MERCLKTELSEKMMVYKIVQGLLHTDKKCKYNIDRILEDKSVRNYKSIVHGLMGR